ncbi:MFS transporter [Sphingomonas sp. AP4-R1]|uniref:MFS transporter n=1 Tax=Sphingomonas sp. AP4-R1 TaxID=2735134 RepID=UPI0014938774|nr:MFS transporter [Sphingomonas sp. AP4-R1]QJU58010.1 MFS transporter [Sphingomonas sp. AP4-R1]
MTAAPAAGASRHAVYFVLLAVLIDAIGFGIVLPVLPDIVMKLGHVDLPEATRIGGWLGVVYAAVQFLSGPLVGNLGDRFGRRPVLLGALAGFAIDYALMGFAPSLGWLFLGRALAGLFGASFGPAGAALADMSTPDERARYFGMMGAAFGIGFVVGPAIGGLLGEFGPRAPFHAAAALATVNLLFGLFLFPETLRLENRRPFSLRRANPVGAWQSLGKLHGVIPISVAAFFWQVASMIYPATWAFFAIAAFGWSPGMIGASLAVVGLLMAFGQMVVVGPIVKRLGERSSVLLGMAAAIGQFVCYIVIREGWMVFAVMLLQPIQSLVFPAMNGLMSRKVPPDAQGELQGFNGSVAAIGAIIAPALFSPALAYFTSDAAPFRFVGVGFAIATVLGLISMAILSVAGRGQDQIPPSTPM